MIPVFKPNYDDEEVDAVTQVLRSGWIGLGPKTEEFEQRFAEYVGSPFAVAVNSATAALHLALLVSNIGPGDEVIVPALTFVSTAHAVSYVGATPVFADVKIDTLCISPQDVIRKITKKTKAVIAVHYGGHPCDMRSLQKIAQKNNLLIIEDAAHACGSSYGSSKIGSISPITCFSFHAVKNLATGDGGMITVKDKEVEKRLKSLRWVGINKGTWDRLEDVYNSKNNSYRAYGWHYEVKELGYKYHMNDISAALGLVQLKKLAKSNKKRRQIAAHYDDSLKDIPEIKCPIIERNIISAQHNYVIRCSNRNELHLFLRERGISTGVHYLPLHLQPFYFKSNSKLKLPIVEKEWKKLLTLPLFPDLKRREQNYIIGCIRKFYK